MAPPPEPEDSKQRPSEQTSSLEHTSHIAPFAPHDAVSVPARHTPLESQQPSHVDSEHRAGEHAASTTTDDIKMMRRNIGTAYRAPPPLRLPEFKKCIREFEMRRAHASRVDSSSRVRGANVRDFALMRVVLMLLLLSLGSCRENPAQGVPPTVRVPGGALDFGVVRVGEAATRTLLINASTAANVQLRSLRVDGDPTLSVDGDVTQVPALSDAQIVVHFTPDAEREVTGELVILSDDAEHPEVRLPLKGRGALPRLSVEFVCAPDCAATLAANLVTFSPQPLARLQPLDVATLPKLMLRSTGDVAAVVNSLQLSGEGFSFVGNGVVPSSGLRLEPGTFASVPLRFQPTNETQVTWEGALSVVADTATTTFELRGALRDNLPPVACASITRVGARDVNWGTTTTAPPRAEVTLSALSSTCTSDPEDGRVGLTWRWSLTQQPAGSAVTLLDATTPTPRLRPVVTGRYTASLEVADIQGNTSTADVTFEAAFQQALVAQLDWAGAPLVDLDVHLVRPGATPFDALGDVNGTSALSPPDGGFDWGARLQFDDTGDGPLVENVSLEAFTCDAGPCTYGVFVHAFRDRRVHSAAPTCVLDGVCLDGASCACLNGTTCVADVAPADAGARGAGRCLPATDATVRLFLNGSATAALSVPLTLGAPCQLLHAADVTWADGGVLVTPRSHTSRYGVRSANTLQCAPAYVEHPR